MLYFTSHRELGRVAFLLSLLLRHLDWQQGVAVTLILEPAPLLGCSEHARQLEEHPDLV